MNWRPLQLTLMLTTIPSFFSGVARTFDFGGILDVRVAVPSPEVADAYAMRLDWEAVGADLRGAAGVVATEIEASEQR